MKNEDIKNYIGAVVNDTHTEEIEKEVPIAELLLLVYIEGLKRNDFPIYLIGRKIDLEKDVPAPYHTFVAYLAILKSECSFAGIDFIIRECELISHRIRNYFRP